MRAQYRQAVQDRHGNVVAGASVTVYEAGTTTPLTVPMYDAAFDGNELSNPLTTDSNGEFAFYVDAPQLVDLKVTTGGTTRTVASVALVADAVTASALVGVSDARAKLLHANPLLLLAAPAVHTIQLDGITVVVDATNAAYTSLPTFQLRYVGVTPNLISLDASPYENLMSAAVLAQDVDYTTAKLLVPLTGVELTADDTLQGGHVDNSFELRIYYRIVDPWLWEDVAP